MKTSGKLRFVQIDLQVRQVVQSHEHVAGGLAQGLELLLDLCLNVHLSSESNQRPSSFS